MRSRFVGIFVVASLVNGFGWHVGRAQEPTHSRRTFTNQMSSSALVVGSADEVEEVPGGLSTLRGNVVLAEANGRVQVLADEVTFDPSTRQYTLKGTVRLQAR